ncbi:CHASE3 domain-containing protein [Actinomadura sp. 3N407]|uniref:sensor histidine kinase n=1 Tax=Actinomadura sp. 3N407 TaxID=3457423 RepID=UPI003FCD0B67
MRGGLTRRVLVASGLLAMIIGTGFAVLLSSVSDLDDLQRRARQSEEVLVAANRLQRIIIDAETGQRGFLLTGLTGYLQPWDAARAAFPAGAASLRSLVAGNAEQEARALRIERAGVSYLRDYSVPLVTAARRDRTSVDAAAATREGKRRVDVIRAEFDRLLAVQRTLAAERQRRSDDADGRAAAAAVVGLGGSIVLVALFAAHLARTIAHPVRRVAAMAGRLADGDLGARVQERHGVGEIAALQRGFNTMATALEENRRELAASRARIVAAADRERRRIERDLHDGIQQRLVSLVLELHAVEAVAPPGTPELRAQLADVAQGLTEAVDELRELSRGIHPAILSEGGLGPALKALARRSPVPVELDVDVPSRPPERVEVAAYFVVSEALANAVKHARASAVWVTALVRDGRLLVSVRDDGVGGATAGQGSGLIGLKDRVHTLNGALDVTSPPGRGTTLEADLPTADR